MLSQRTYLRLIRASALYDIVVVAPFATPWTFALLYAQLSHLNQWRGAVQWWPTGSSTPRAAFTSAAPMRSSRGG